jgi:hypothetical protein
MLTFVGREDTTAIIRLTCYPDSSHAVWFRIKAKLLVQHIC